MNSGNAGKYWTEACPGTHQPPATIEIDIRVVQYNGHPHALQGFGTCSVCAKRCAFSSKGIHRHKSAVAQAELVACAAVSPLDELLRAALRFQATRLSDRTPPVEADLALRLEQLDIAAKKYVEITLREPRGDL